MAKSKTKPREDQPAQKDSSAAVTGTFDPSLAALFATSSGPVTLPTKPVRTYDTASKPASKTKGVAEPAAQQAEPTSDSDNEVGSEDAEDLSSGSDLGSEVEAEPEQSAERPRKRRRVDDNADLESKYLDKLVREEEEEIKQRRKQDSNVQEQVGGEGNGAEDSDSDLNSGLDDLSDSDDDLMDGDKQKEKEKRSDELPKHESLTTHEAEAAKSSRTVFLGNVANTVIKSKSAKKTLILHLRSALAEKHHEKIESMRFRSSAFVSDAGPKRAAYAKKELMDETMKSTNAYVVLNTDAAARKVARLNGTIVLGRHLRVDNLGQPSRIDHRRCVFVGNLSFTDDATTNEENEDGTQKRKRAREPADVEEGLWQTFGKCGKVESVRVVRDKETRISKGFAYVQFMDENAVEAALLLNEKKFPPMLPRVLRVQRAKKDMKGKKGGDPQSQGQGSRDRQRDKPGVERSQSRGPQRGPPGARMNAQNSREKVVLEGHRANTGSLPKGLKKLTKRKAVKPTGRGTRRAATFRAGGGRKKRDMES